MSVFWGLFLFFLVTIVLFVGYFLLSSFLEDSFRFRMSGFSLIPNRGSFDRNYARTMTTGGAGLSEAIELQELNDDNRDSSLYER